MTITTSKKNTKKPSKRRVKGDRDWANKGNNKAIGREAYTKIKEWLALQDDEQRATRRALLMHDLPWGSFISAELHPSRTDVIALKVDHKNWNSPRLFDLAAFALMQLLTAFGGRMRINNRQATDPAKMDGPKHFFPAVNLGNPTNFGMARIIWGATTSGEVDQLKSGSPSTANRNIDDLVETFYDLRLANLSGDTGNKPAVRTRGDAIMGALIFRHNLQDQVDSLPTADDYLGAIQRCFVLLDELKEKVLKQRKG